MEHHDRTQSGRGEQRRPDRKSNTENAEGSRETAYSDIGNQEERGTRTRQAGGELTEEAVGQADNQGGGISNRPLEQEQDRQDHLPPRGERRADWKED